MFRDEGKSIEQLEKELASLHQQQVSQVDTSITKLLQSLKKAGITTKCINQDNFLWLLEHHLPKYMNSYGVREDFPVKNGKITDTITDKHIFDLLRLYNIFETGDERCPLSYEDISSIIQGKEIHIDENKRNTSFMSRGIVDECGNFQMDGLNMVIKEYEEKYLSIPTFIQEYKKITSVYKKYKSRYPEFLRQILSQSAIKKVWKKYGFLEKLNSPKQLNYIEKNISERDWLEIIEACISLAYHQSQLPQVEDMLHNIHWYDELTQMRDISDYALIPEMKQVFDRYNEIRSSLGPDFKELETLWLSGDFKTLFYTKIFPTAIHNTATSDFVSQDEKKYKADLRFEQTKEEFERMQREHKKLQSITDFSIYPLLEAKDVCKKRLELECMYCFLMNLQNSEQMQQSLISAMSHKAARERLFLEDISAIGTLTLLYEMYTGAKSPKVFEGPWGIFYYVEILPSIITLFSNLYED